MRKLIMLVVSMIAVIGSNVVLAGPSNTPVPTVTSSSVN